MVELCFPVFISLLIFAILSWTGISFWESEWEDQGWEKESQKQDSGGLWGLEIQNKFTCITAPFEPLQWRSRKQVSIEHLITELHGARAPLSSSFCKVHVGIVSKTFHISALEGNCQAADPLSSVPPRAKMLVHYGPFQTWPWQGTEIQVPCFIHRTLRDLW